VKAYIDFQICIILEFYAANISSLSRTFRDNLPVTKRPWQTTNLRCIKSQKNAGLTKRLQPVVTHFLPVKAIVKRVPGSLCSPHTFWRTCISLSSQGHLWRASCFKQTENLLLPLTEICQRAFIMPALQSCRRSCRTITACCTIDIPSRSEM